MAIDKRPNGRWRARWREYPGGPQKSRTFDRKLDAQRFLTSVEGSKLAGSYVDPDAGRVTVRDFAAMHQSRQPWRASTVEVFEKSMAHVLPVLGERPIATIRKGDIQAFVSGLKLASSTAATVLQHLGGLLEAAAGDGLIARNPARGVKAPAGTGGDVVPPTVEQVEALRASAPDWFRPAVVLGAGLGLRTSEASGLTADRILWLERAVRVDRQWNSRQPLAAFAPPKTAASARTVPAAAVVLDYLAEHVGRRHTGFVLHRGGEPVDHQAFGYAWRRTRAKAGLPAVRFHDLRHAFASMLISAGCSVRAVSAALGHSSAATTLNVYSHMWPGDEDRIRAAVDGALSGAAESWLSPTAKDPSA